MRSSVIVDVAVRVLFPSIVVLSLYFLFSGHNQPGGGFAGGLVAGAAIALRYIAGGVTQVRAITRVRPWSMAGAGLAISTITAIVPVVLGESVLEHADVTWHAGPLGTIKFTTALPFDIGVYVLVVGVVLMIFEAFGEHEGEE